MASTWSALKVELQGTGDNPGTWGTATNANLGDAVLGEAITGSATVDFASDADVTVTLTDSATSQSARNLRLNITESGGGVGSVRNLILGSGCQIEKFYLINNTGTGAKTIKNTSGTGISVPAGKATLVFNDGTNVVDAASYFTSLTLGSALPVASGGTGLTAGTSGGIPAYTATGTLTSSGVLAQYGVVIGGGAGAVPTSTAVGTATHVLTSNGAGVAPTFQALPAGGVTTFNAGTTGFTPNTATSGAVTLAGTLAVANGGTGQTSYTNGQLLIGNTTGNTLTKATLTQGTGVTITNSTGSITVANSGVTSLVAGTGISVSGATGAVTVTATAGSASLTEFTSSGTWTKPTCTFVMVELYGAGGGGGGGLGSNGGTQGPGAAGGAYAFRLFKATDLAATVTVTLGTGGSPGTGTSSDTAGAAQDGAAGGNSTFGSHLTSFGGGGGATQYLRSQGGGALSVGSSTADGSTLFSSGAPAVSINTTGTTVYRSVDAGGFGGGRTSDGDVITTGGASGFGGGAGGVSLTKAGIVGYGSAYGGSGGGSGGRGAGGQAAGGAGGTFTAYRGGGGAAGTTTGSSGNTGGTGGFRQGGGGGGGSQEGTAGTGGTGGFGGGGGGGGGGNSAGFSGASGGTGGAGYARVYAW